MVQRMVAQLVALKCLDPKEMRLVCCWTPYACDTIEDGYASAM
jgi:hypothetical protein